MCKGGATSRLPSDKGEPGFKEIWRNCTHALHFGEELLEEVHRRDPSGGGVSVDPVQHLCRAVSLNTARLREGVAS